MTPSWNAVAGYPARAADAASTAAISSRFIPPLSERSRSRVKAQPTMRFSESARALLKRLEGCRLVSYQDQAGIWTIGYGHTGR